MEEACKQLLHSEVEEDKCELSLYENALKKLVRLLGELVAESRGEGELCEVFVVCAGHCGAHYWTSVSSRQLATEALLSISRLYGYSGVSELLNGNEDLRTAIFGHLRDVLTRNKWKICPVLKQAFIWVVKHIKHPNLAPHLDSILPPVLWMLDDHVDYNRIQALSVMTHIIQQMDPTELRWHGRAELLYESMKPLLYVSSSELIFAVHSCMLQLLPVLDCSPSPVPAKPNRTDEIFDLLISALAKESNIALQRAYVAQVKGYVLQLGIFTVRHIKTLLPVLLLGLQYSDPQREILRKLSLQTLCVLISYTWPRAPTYKMTIITALSKLVYNLDNDPHHLLDLVVKCLHVLLTACPELKAKYEWLAESCNHQIMQSCLQQALDKSTCSEQLQYKQS